MNAFLTVIPDRYKTLMGSRFTKPAVIRPSRLSMFISDPSEAVESSNIMPLLHKHFDVIEVKGFGGSILHLLLAGIGHHFVNPDRDARRILELCFEAEDALIASGDLQHDFVLAVCRKRGIS